MSISNLKIINLTSISIDNLWIFIQLIEEIWDVERQNFI